jgi:IclR helix-turn-helix domain
MERDTVLRLGPGGHIRDLAFVSPVGEPETPRGFRFASSRIATSNMPESDDIKITLSKTQIKQVMRGATDEEDLTRLLGGVGTLKLASYRASLSDERLSRSLLRGLMVLASFPPDGSARQITDVAKQLGLGASTTHRYAITLVELGLLERDPISRHYRLPTG